MFDVNNVATLWTGCAFFIHSFAQTLCCPAVFTEPRVSQISNNDTEQPPQLIHMFSEQKSPAVPWILHDILFFPHALCRCRKNSSIVQVLFCICIYFQNCMLGVDKDQVWIGSEDSIIYIINMVAMVCNRQLTEHRAEVTGLALDNDKYR